MIVMRNAGRTGLFDILGRLWYLADQDKTAYATRAAVTAEIAAALAANVTLPSGAEQAAFRYQAESLLAAESGLTRIALQLTRELVRKAAAADTGRPLSEVESAKLVVAQMTAAGYYVTAPTVNVATAAAGGNVGDAQLLAAALAPDGRPGPLWIAETGEVAYTSAAAAKSKASLPLDSAAWPGGTGYQSEGVYLVDLDYNLLANGPLAVESGRITGWIARGAQWSEILPPQDTITFSATPTGGSFRLSFLTRGGVTRYTGDIPHNAVANDVAAAVAALDAETATVRVSALSPGGPGFVLDWPRGRYDLPTFGIESDLTGAAASITRTRTGTTGGYAGTAIRFNGDGVELTGLYQRFRAAGDGTAVLVARIFHNGATGGTLQIGLVDGATSAATPVLRASGDANAASFTLSALAADQFHVLTCPLAWKEAIDGYVTLRLTSPLTNGKVLVLNRPQLVAFSGQTLTRPGLLLLANRFGPESGDAWTWTTTNNYAGKVGGFWLRAFGEPTAALPRSGATLIGDDILAP